MTQRHRMMMYYGYAFESYCTSATPTRTETGPVRGGDPPGWGGDVDTNVQWCSVVKGKLGDIRMVIGGEVDCVRGGYYRQCKSRGRLTRAGKYTGQPDTFVELKTSQEILDQQGATKFERYARLRLRCRHAAG